jgi:hypothetical protein
MRPSFPPEFYWTRYGQTAARVNRVFGRNWHAALPVALAELERAGEALIQQLRASTELAKVQMVSRPTASLREILEDLEALEDEFPDVHWDLKEKTLSVITEPVRLRDIELGRFEIVLDYRHLHQTRPYRVIALDPNPAAGEESTTHPHVRSEDLCEGEGKGPIQKALRAGRVYDLFVLINQVLHTYNADSAYIPLSRWEGTRCRDCGSVVSDDDSVSCDACGDDACPECSTACSGCCRSLCCHCQDRCMACGDLFCRNCLARCPGCSENHCAPCLEQGRCEDCLERNTHDEEDAEEEVLPDAEVQPVCVGQAPVPEGPGPD